MNRKSFLRKMSLTLSAIAGLIAGISLLRQLYPPSFIRGLRLKIGKLHEYPIDNYTFVDKNNLFVYRDHEGVKAVSAVCTHLGCTLHRSTDGFVCPCHGSVYNNNGQVLSGPAPTDLKWYKVEESPDGNLVVDKNETVNPDDVFRG